ncbi:hypothetical protein D3C72_1864700 [compost metagenome]
MVATILAARIQELRKGVGAVVVIPVCGGNVLKQPEITLAQSIAHIAKPGGVRRMLAGIHPGQVQRAGHGFAGKGAQCHPVVSAFLFGVAVFLLLQVEASIGGGNSSGALCVVAQRAAFRGKAHPLLTS